MAGHADTLSAAPGRARRADAPGEEEPSQPPLRVVVAEEREIVRRGLIAALQEDPGLRVVAGTGSRSDADDFDVAVVSAQIARHTRFRCPVIVCADRADPPSPVDPANDVIGVLGATLTGLQLRATVRAAAAGLRVHASNESASDEPLDQRARRVLELVADGLSTREIALRMSYSERTIKKLITSLEHRFRARNRAHIVAYAIRHGLI